MADFGPRLREAREARGVSLREIASATKISVGALEALERNDLSRLPGGIFGRSFVRAYALEIGLDPDVTLQEFLVEYDRQHQAAAVKATPEVTADDRAFLERQRRAARWLKAGLVVVFLGGVAAAVNWRLGSRARTAEAHAKAAADAAAPPSSPSAPATSSAAPPPASMPPPATANSTQVVVRLEATADCWVRAAVDGTVVFERVLGAGESHEMAPGEDVTLQVGNAGVIRWSINGRPARGLGKVGQSASARITRATMTNYLQ